MLTELAMDDDVETIDLLDDFHVYRKSRHAFRQQDIGNFPNRECPGIMLDRRSFDWSKHNRKAIKELAAMEKRKPIEWFQILDCSVAPDGTLLPLFAFDGGILKRSFRKLCSKSRDLLLIRAAILRQRKLDIDAYEAEQRNDPGA